MEFVLPPPPSWDQWRSCASSIILLLTHYWLPTMEQVLNTERKKFHTFVAGVHRLEVGLRGTDGSLVSLTCWYCGTLWEWALLEPWFVPREVHRPKTALPHSCNSCCLPGWENEIGEGDINYYHARCTPHVETSKVPANFHHKLE